MIQFNKYKKEQEQKEKDGKLNGDEKILSPKDIKIDINEFIEFYKQ